MFLDKAKIKIESGKGGNGMVAWRREKYVDKGGPAGGDGGNGADVYFIVDDSMSTLMDFKYKSIFKAEDGENGRGKSQHGRCGKDLYIKVPIGTIVRDASTGKIIADLKNPEQTVLIAKGGKGGRGNSRFVSSQKRAPQFCEPGEPSIVRELELELKLIADVGLLGLPNAGKSTFISAISSAKPKIADYPFTTLVPNLGVVKNFDESSYVVADIPGLIEGASEGIGLGHEFLRHVERCRFLVHIVDLTLENPVENYHKINSELAKHDKRLSEAYQIVALNKIDAVDEETQNEYFNQFKKLADDVFLISAVSRKGLKELLTLMSEKVKIIEKPELEVIVEDDEAAYDNDDSDFQVYKVDKNSFVVEGGKLFRLANVTDSRNFDQLHRFLGILDSMGVMSALEMSGAKDGDSVKIGHLEFEYFK